MTTDALPVVDPTLASALARAAELLRELPPAQLEELAAGRGRLEYRPCSPRPARHPVPRGADVAASDVAAAVRAINAMTAPEEVACYLRRRRFPVPVLKEIARALGPTVLSTGRSRGELERNIVQGTAGYRVRSAAMSGGAWS